MKSVNVTANTSPEHITVVRLQDDIFDVSVAENITPVTVERRVRGSDEPQQENKYAYDRYNAIVTANDYGTFIAGVLHIKYNADDENALINKGIADSGNAEYKAYRDFVAEIKAEAIKYFENN